MSNWTKQECRILGDFLIANLEEAKAEVRQEIAVENRGHAVASEDANTFDTQTPQQFRERSISLAVANINAKLDL